MFDNALDMDLISNFMKLIAKVVLLLLCVTVI